MGLYNFESASQASPLSRAEPLPSKRAPTEKEGVSRVRYVTWFWQSPLRLLRAKRGASRTGRGRRRDCGQDGERVGERERNSYATVSGDGGNDGDQRLALRKLLLLLHLRPPSGVDETLLLVLRVGQLGGS